jgi:membrane protein
MPADAAAREQQRHGRQARWPSEIPRRGWWDILLRVKDSQSSTNISLIAAGLAFYAFLAIPSAFTALVALYGLVFDAASVGRQVDAMASVMPSEARQIIATVLTTITSSPSAKLGLALVISVLVALWSARSGTASLMTALNIAYGEQEKRGIIRFNLHAMLLTLSAVIFAIVALALVALLPAIIDLLPLGPYSKLAATIVRWPVLLCLVMVALAATYRFAPSRESARWRWVSWGAAVATLLWLAGSALFSLYVTEFASYDKTYGSLGAVVVLLMWLYVSSYVVLLGATLNAEIEHQTERDSTTGSPKPMGQRGATMADTAGESR